MLSNKFKLLAASSLAVVGLAGVSALHFVSAATPEPLSSSVTQSPITTGNDKEVNDATEAGTDNVNDKNGVDKETNDTSAVDKETNDTSAVDTDNINDQQGDHLGSDSNSATDKKD
jgi:hypothetical protein